MDSAIGFLFVLMVLFLLFFCLALLYKNRVVVGKWLNSPYYACDDRELKLRRRIEDSEKELNDIEAKKTETGG